MGANIERRTVNSAELRVANDTSPKIIGHAALFYTLSEDLGNFQERIEPGAFTESLLNDDIRALYNHDANVILGRNRAGTLRLAEDDQGLSIEIDPPATEAARGVVVAIERGDITQMSFGFTVKPDGQRWDRDAEGRVCRTLTAVRLFDVSPVVFAAYSDTRVAVRSLEDWQRDQRSVPVSLLRRRLDLTVTI